MEGKKCSSVVDGVLYGSSGNSGLCGRGNEIRQLDTQTVDPTGVTTGDLAAQESSTQITHLWRKWQKLEMMCTSRWWKRERFF
ncbi:MAG: hypothetical protein ACLTER_15050 [Ruminococcus sp.]